MPIVSAYLVILLPTAMSISATLWPNGISPFSVTERVLASTLTTASSPARMSARHVATLSVTFITTVLSIGIFLPPSENTP